MVTVDQLDTIDSRIDAILPAGWDDMRVSLTRATTGSAAPSLAVFLSPVQAYSFSKTTAQEVFFDVQLPHSWIPGTALEPHIHWSPGVSTDTGVVQWQLEYMWANVNDPFPAPTLLATVDQAASGVAYAHQLADLGTMAGTGKKASSVIMCRLARVAGAAADTFDAVAWGLSVDFHYENRGFGGLTEYAGAI